MADLAALAAKHGGSAAAAEGEAGGKIAALAAKHGGAAASAAATDTAKFERETEQSLSDDYLIPGTNTRVPYTRYLNSFLVGTGRGIIDLWAGGRQIMGAGEEYTAQQTEDVRQYEKLTKIDPIAAGAGRVAGQVAPTLVVPGGAIVKGAQALSKTVPALPLLARAGMGTEAATMGGLQGFMNFVPEGESRLENTVTSAATAGLFTKGLQGAAAVAPKVIPGLSATQSELQRIARPSAQATTVTVDDVAKALKEEGIDFGALPAKIREGLVEQANEAVKAGAPISIAELARVARAKNLPVSAELTKGQMTRDPNQLRTEHDLRRTSAGGAIEARMGEQEEALAGSLEVIKLKSGGVSTPGREAESGRRIVGPILKQAQASESKVSALYKAADKADETLAEVDASPLVLYLNDNAPAALSVPELNSIGAALKKLGVISGEDPARVGAATFTERAPTIRELEEVRKLAVQLGKKDDAAGHFMREVKNVIDGMTDGKGGELYKKARTARVQHALEFEDPGIVNRLIEMKSRTDRVTPYDDVFRVSVLNSSADDLTRVRDQLLQKGDDPKLRDAGVQAFKDMRAATLDYLKLGALSNAKEEWSHAGFKKAVEAIGPEKLEILFGKNTANQLQQVLASSADMRAVFNKAGIHNPGTASALVEWLDRITGIVGLGRVGTYTSAAAKNIAERLSAGGKVAESLAPLEEAFKAGAAAKERQVTELLKLYAGKVGAAGGRVIAAGASASAAADEQ